MNRILHVVLAGMVAAGPAQAQLCQPELVRTIGGAVRDVEIVGDYLYAATVGGVAVVDIVDPNAPTIVGWQDTAGEAVGITVVGSIAYVAMGEHGLQLLDVSDPMNPFTRGSVDTPGFARRVAIADDWAYLADSESGLQIIDVSDPGNVVVRHAVDTPGIAQGVALQAGWAFVGDGVAGLQVVDTADPLSALIVQTVDTPGDAQGVAVSGAWAFLADGDAGMQVIDIGEPLTAQISGSESTSNTATDVLLAGDLAYVAGGGPVTGLAIVDVAEPVNPVLVGALSDNYAERGTGLSVVDDIVYLASGSNGLPFVDVGNPATPLTLGRISLLSRPQELAFSGSIVFVGDSPTPFRDDYSGVHILDIGSENPFLGFVRTPGHPEDVTVSGDFAYIADGFRGIARVDISDLSSPVIVERRQVFTERCFDIAVTDSLLLAVCGGTLFSFDASDLTMLGFVDSPNYASDVSISIPWAFMPESGGFFTVVDLGDPEDPQPLTSQDILADARSISINGTRAYVAELSAGLRVVDVTDPEAPLGLGSLSWLDFRAYRVASAGRLAFVSASSLSTSVGDRLFIVDVSNPDVLSEIASIEVPGSEGGVAVSDSTVVVAGSGLHVIDIASCLPINLTISDLSGPTNGLAGQQFQVSWVAANDGDTSAAEPWSDKVYYADPNGAIRGLLGEFAAPSELAPGESYRRSVQVAFPTEPGTYSIVVEVDANDNVNEIGAEDDNVAVWGPVAVEPIPLPDLAVQIVSSPPDGIFTGTSTEFTYRVTNIGTGTTEPPVWGDLFFISFQDDIEWDGINGNDQIFCNLEVGSRSVPNPRYLEPNQAYEQTVMINLPEDQPGTWYAYVLPTKRVGCHPGADVAELDKSNNVARVPFQVALNPAQPDLVSEAIEHPDLPFSGQMMTVSWADTNQGTGPTDGGGWTDAVYLSRNNNPTIDPNDLLFGSRLRSGQPLQNNETDDTLSVTARIPAPLFGMFYVKVLTDSADQVSEAGRESNNVGVGAEQMEISLSVQPDLLPLDVNGAARESDVIPGHVFDVSWSAKNNGPPPLFAFGWRDAIYLSRDEALDANDALLGTFQNYTGESSAGEPLLNPYTRTRSVRIPDETEPGSYRVLVALDSANEVFELDKGELNNTLASEAFEVVLLPTDLAVEVNFAPEYQLPTVAAADQEVVLSWRVSNLGLAGTPVNAWQDRVYLSADTELGEGDDLVLTITRNEPLAAGESYVAVGTAAVPLRPPGSYYLLVKTDAGEVVFEASDLGANVAVSPFTISAEASDLVIDPNSVVAPPSVRAGESVGISWEGLNQGVLETNASTWIDAIYLSRDDSLDSEDTPLATRTVSSLGGLVPGERYEVESDVTIPLSAAGQYYLIIEADAHSDVFEANEENNRQASPMLVDVEERQPANLVIVDVQAPEAAVSGQPMAVSWTVRNTGPEATFVSSWRDAVYLSRDSFIDPGTDYYLGGATRTEGLDPNRSYTMQSDFTIPFGATGPYFVLVATDRGGEVFESSTADNSASAPGLTDVQVPSPAETDIVVGAITVPESALLGEDVEFRWEIRNNGTRPLTASWRDSAYLSADEEWDIADPRIKWRVNGKMQDSLAVSVTDLAPGDFVVVEGTGRVPAMLPGDYRVFVRTDVLNSVPEVDEVNNLSAPSLAVVAVSAIPLDLAVSAEGELATGQDAYYQLDVPADETIRVTLEHSSATAWTELYVRFGEVPTPGSFDFSFDNPAQPDQVVVIPNSLAGRYYILARATANAGGAMPAQFAIRAEVVPYSVTRVDPSAGGNVGSVTLAIHGARFDSSAAAFLVDSDGGRIEAYRTAVLDSTQMFASFNLSGAPAGDYGLHVESVVEYWDLDPNANIVDRTLILGEDTLQDAFVVVDGGGPQVEHELVLPSRARFGTVFSCFVEIENRGNVDAELPVILVASPNQVPIGVAPSELAASQIQVIPVGSSFRDVLRPGEVRIVQLFALATRFPSSQFRIQNLAMAEELINWDALEAYYRDGSDLPVWTATWDRLRSMVGVTWRDLHAVLRCLAVSSTPPGDRDFHTGHELMLGALAAARSGKDRVDCVPLSLTSPAFGAEAAHRPICNPPMSCVYGPGSFVPCGCGPFYGLNGLFLDAIELDLASGPRRLLLSSACFGPDWMSVYDDFLAGTCASRPGLRFFGSSSAPAVQLRDAPETKNVVDSIMNQVLISLTSSCPEDLVPCGGEIVLPLADLVPEVFRLDLPLNWNATCTEGGGLVGGVGRGDDPGRPDRRDAIGQVIVRRICDCDGERTISVEAEPDFEILVLDTYDFCPGDLGGLAAQVFTVPLARLEANNRAYDVPLEIRFLVTAEHFDPLAISPALFPGQCEEQMCPLEPPAPNCASACEEDCSAGGNDGGADCCEGPDCDAEVPTEQAFDPNLKRGPRGFGAEEWVPSRRVPYEILFENLPEATAPAARVTITDALEEGFALSSFRLGDIRFSETVVDVPEGRVAFQRRIDLTASRGVFVDITAGVDALDREAFWVFQSIDPSTGEPPINPQVGFLPPNDPNDPVRPGEGTVEFSIEPSLDTPTGTLVRNRASIVFDLNAAIVTDEVVRTIDGDPPSSLVAPLSPEHPTSSIQLSWTGDDVGSGLAGFAVFGRVDGGAYGLVIGPSDEFGATFVGRGGGVYDFYSIAHDNTGNEEDPPTVPDATTRIAVQAPGAPDVAWVAATSFLLNGLPDGNLDRIEHAVSVEPGGQWVGQGGMLQAAPHWQPRLAWGDLRVRGLSADTEYTLRAKARDASAETPLGEAATLRTDRVGDADGDGDIDFDDLLIVLGGFGGCEGEVEFDFEADFNGNGCVDLADLALLLSVFGE